MPCFSSGTQLQSLLAQSSKQTNTAALQLPKCSRKALQEVIYLL